MAKTISHNKNGIPIFKPSKDYKPKQKGRKKFSKCSLRVLLKKTKGLCYYCGKPLTIHTATRDHYVPLAQRGSNHVENIVPACKECNEKKGSLRPKSRKESKYD